MNDKTLITATAATRRIDTITNALLAVIVIIPFILSATALADLAAANGQRPAFLYPIMVDGGLIIFKLLVLRAALRGRTDKYAWSMAVTATAISVGLNVYHAGAEAGQVGRLMSALPPLAILAAFVAVTRRVEETAVEQGMVNGIERLRSTWAADRAAAAAEAAAAQAALDKLAGQAERLAGQIESLKADKAEARKAAKEAAAEKEKADKAAAAAAKEAAKAQKAIRPTEANVPAKAAGHDGLTERQTAVLNLIQSGQTQAEIAAALNVSERTIRREISSLNGAVKEMS